MDIRINEMFGTSFQIQEMERIVGLPVYMSARRTFYDAVDGDIRFVLVRVAEEERFGSVALSKQQEMLEEHLHVPVAFWFKSVTRTQREALMRRHISFVADGDQLYMPFLGIALHNRRKVQPNVQVDHMMPVTQSLFLYMLYECKGREVIKMQAAADLGVTRMSITRAARQLEAMGIIVQEMRGKECYMWTERTGHELFLQAREYLINPIQRSVIVERSDALHDLPMAGESALAARTMLGAPQVPCVAIYKASGKDLALTAQEEQWSDGKDVIRVEAWRYDPERFAGAGVVDPVSLYMSLVDCTDERVQGALEDMMEGYAW